MATAFAACGNYDYKKTKEGLVYKIFPNGKGDPIKPGQFVKVYMRTSVNDSVIMDNFGRLPAYGPHDTTRKGSYNFTDFLGEMKIGDSAIFSIPVDTLQKKGMLQYNEVFKKGATINGSVKVLKAFGSEKEITSDYQAEMENEKKREISGLEAYLKENKITNAQKTPNGVFVVIEKVGTGLFADSGTEVKVNYTGYLKSGKKFDSNVDSSFHHQQPFEFKVGSHQVIAGWDEGIRLLKQGGKGKLYVPAMLAYGQQSQGDKMPAYSDLVFEVEIIDVKPATSEPTNLPGKK